MGVTAFPHGQIPKKQGVPAMGNVRFSRPSSMLDGFSRFHCYKPKPSSVYSAFGYQGLSDT